MKLKNYALIFVFVLSLQGLWAQNLKYSFFTAGHTYGDPMNPQYGLHPPFVDFIPELNVWPGLELGFLTGDVVFKPWPKYWDTAQIDISMIDVPVYIAPGNHDLGEEFVERFGPYYYSFFHNDDLFIVLTPGLDNWNITGDQLEFLEQALESGENSKNIFVFLHELIWWSPTNFYSKININYEPHYPGSTNFDEVIKPLLLSCPNNITVYAGDLGATKIATPYMIHHFDNITLIGSGMGRGERDNIIITEVYDDSVYYDLIALNFDDHQALGELTDVALSIDPQEIVDWKLRVYPNPSAGYFMVENRFNEPLKVSLHTIYGQLVFQNTVDGTTTQEFNTLGIKPGLHVMSATNGEIFIERKIFIQ